MKIFQMVTILLYALIMVSCASNYGNPSDHGEATPPASVSTTTGIGSPGTSTHIIKTNSPLISPNPSSTNTLSPISSPSRTPSPTSPVSLNTQCLETLDDIPVKKDLTGRIVLWVDLPPFPSAFIYDLQSGEIIDLPVREDESIFIQGVSPNQRYLAYTIIRDLGKGVKSSTLFIADYDGKTLATVPLESNWLFVGKWIDNEYISISKFYPEDYKFSLVILNPFTKETKELTEIDLPGLETDAPSPWVDYSPPIVFSSTHNAAAFRKGNGDVVLWDFQTNQEVLAISDTTLTPPSWSPDSLAFVVAASIRPASIYKELYLVSAEKGIQRITYLTQAYRELSISGISWSPDGQSIALGLVGEPKSPSVPSILGQEQGANLAVLNLETQEVRILCQKYGRPASPIWSGDSNQLVFANWDIDPKEMLVYLVDLREGWVVKLLPLEGYEPAGWMLLPGED